MGKTVNDYLNGMDKDKREICSRLRKIILKTFPNIKEEMRWGAIVFDDGYFYIGN